MKKFLVVYENLVTSDVISELIDAPTIPEADMIAWEHSQRTGLSEGNYSLYQVNPDGTVMDCCVYLD